MQCILAYQHAHGTQVPAKQKSAKFQSSRSNDWPIIVFVGREMPRHLASSRLALDLTVGDTLSKLKSVEFYNENGGTHLFKIQAAQNQHHHHI